jgi:YHS domain-containing protein
MTRTMHLSFVLLAFAGATALVGCKDDAKDQPPTPAADAPAETDLFAALPAADEAAARAQRVCPVTGEALDSMGGPIKVTIEGRDVFLCCEHCVEALEEDPAKYFAILDGAAADAADEAEDTAEAAEDAATDEAEKPAAEGEADGDAAEGEAAEPAESAATS